jgi:hypothetical protein
MSGFVFAFFRLLVYFDEGKRPKERRKWKEKWPVCILVFLK